MTLYTCEGHGSEVVVVHAGVNCPVCEMEQAYNRADRQLDEANRDVETLKDEIAKLKEREE